jgi:hypothetical protein
LAAVAAAGSVGHGRLTLSAIESAIGHGGVGCLNSSPGVTNGLPGSQRFSMGVVAILLLARTLLKDTP